MESERLQKFMAEAGAGSRRRCEEWILDGQVRVNGQVVRELGTRVDPERDEVVFRGKTLFLPEKKVTVALYKPAGYITTAKDQFGRPQVTELVKIPNVRLYPVGRLDYQTTGLLLLTNDGELACALTHPKHHIAKCYQAVLKGRIQPEDVKRLCEGVLLEDGYTTAPAEVRLLGPLGRDSRIEITVYEGKNHQIRKMARAVGHPVLRLKRVRVGNIGLQGLKEGEYRELTEQELAELRRSLS